jgi:hypothetical protein
MLFLYVYNYVYLFVFVLSVLVYGMLPLSENSIALNNNNNNLILFISFKKKLISLCVSYNLPIDTASHNAGIKSVFSNSGNFSNSMITSILN